MSGREVSGQFESVLNDVILEECTDFCLELPECKFIAHDSSTSSCLIYLIDVTNFNENTNSEVWAKIATVEGMHTFYTPFTSNNI